MEISGVVVQKRMERKKKVREGEKGRRTSERSRVEQSGKRTEEHIVGRVSLFGRADSEKGTILTRERTKR